MRRLLFLGCGLLVLMLAACSSGNDAADDQERGAAQPAATAVVDEPTAVTEEPTSAPKPTAEAADSGAVDGILSAFSLLSGPAFGGAGPASLPDTTGEADPALKAALLTLNDLESGYSELVPGGMSFSMDTDEGSMEIALSMFAKGESTDAFPESMVMSGVMTGSGALMDQSLGELQGYVDSADLEKEIQDALGGGEAMFGIGFDDVRTLDASGLGEGGIGLHMVMTMDLSQLGFEMPPEAQFLADGLAFDMYIFQRGDHFLMLMVMWPGAGASPVDVRGLAEVMDARAGAAF